MLMMRQAMIRSLTVLTAGISAPTFADSPLQFTIEAPGIQTSQIVETDEVTVHTQDFDSVFNRKKVFRSARYDNFKWRGIGTYQGSGAKVDKKNKYGGAGGRKHYLFIKNTGGSIDNNPGVTLTFDEPVAYFGFWWSAGDYNNKLQVTLTDGTVVDVVTQLVLDSEGFVNKLSSKGGHLGSPTNKYKDQNGREGYAYLNLFAKTEEQKIQKIRFHGTNFETDNHSVTTEIIPDPPGICITGCEPPIDPDPPIEPDTPPALTFGEKGRFNLREVNTHIIREAPTGGGISQ